eukprot:scaffold56195_cov30-Attheya_sp.AAC.1
MELHNSQERCKEVIYSPRTMSNCTAWDQNDARTLPKSFSKSPRKIEKSLAHDAYLSLASEALRALQPFNLWREPKESLRKQFDDGRCTGSAGAAAPCASAGVPSWPRFYHGVVAARLG